MNNLIIYGAGNIAELAHYYFSNDSGYNVVGFCVDSEYFEESIFCGLPVITVDNLEERFPPTSTVAFVALSYSNLNKGREDKYNLMKKKGYKLVSYISSKATNLGKKIGENCFILEDNTIQPFVEIGNNVVLWSGNHIGHHSLIHDHCFITSHVVISGGVEVGNNAFIGVNATIRDHIQIGAHSVIGAASIVMRSTEEYSVYVPQRTDPRDISSDSLKRI